MADSSKTPSMAVMTAQQAVSAADFLAPATIPHYEPDEVTTRMVPLRDLWWVVTYFAEHDGIGWLVKRCTVRPAEAAELAALGSIAL